MPTVVGTKWRVALKARRRDGIGGVVRLLGRSAADHLMYPLVQRRHADFDRQHGVDTAAQVANADLDHTGNLFKDSNWYAAVPLHQIQNILHAITEVAERPLSDFTFVDLGCGKGLPLLLAMRHGFGRATGVELDAGLVTIARRNADIFAAKTGIRGEAIEVVCQDAATFTFPGQPMVLFVCNSFGPATLNAVLDNAVASGQPFFVAYYNAVHREVLDSHPALKPLRRTVRWSLYSVVP